MSITYLCATYVSYQKVGQFYLKYYLKGGEGVKHDSQIILTKNLSTFTMWLNIFEIKLIKVPVSSLSHHL